MKVYNFSFCIFIIFASAFAEQKFVLNGTDNKPCFLEEFDATFTVLYKTKSGKNSGTVVFPQDATINETSSCSDTKAVITLMWGEISTNYFTQTFERKDENATLFALSSVELSLSLADPKLFPASTEDATTLQMSVPSSFISADTDYAYECMSERTVKQGDLSVTFETMRVRPFNVQGMSFGDAELCAEDMSAATDMTTVTGMTTKTDMTTVTQPPPHTTPSPSPYKNTLFNVTDPDTGKSCLLDTFNATLVYNFTTATKTKTNTNDIKYAVLDEANSYCHDDEARLAIKFDKNHMSSILQTFRLIEVSGSTDYYLSELSVTINTEGSKLVTYSFKVDNSTFQAPNTTAYKCNHNDTLTGNAPGNLTLNVTFREVLLQPFGVVNNTFSHETVCEADQTISNVVPIAVGCALAALVVIVLIAYLIGRRNSSRSGYESV